MAMIEFGGYSSEDRAVDGCSFNVGNDSCVLVGGVVRVQ